VNEFDFEAVPGLPGPLPSGERVLWRGAPGIYAFASSAFRARGLMFYFALLVAVQIGFELAAGSAFAVVAGTATWTVCLATIAIALVFGTAWAYARTTVYTVTNRRIVMRFGVAVPLAVNLPFTVIDAAAVRIRADGSGDVVLTLGRAQRVGIVHLWPCVQVWRLIAPRPVLRGVPEVQTVARILGDALGGTMAREGSGLAATRPHELGVAA